MIKRIFQQFFLLFFIVSLADCFPQRGAARAAFLSDKDAKIFWQYFINNQLLSDYVALIRIESFHPDHEKFLCNGIILHKNRKFIIEFDDYIGTSGKFLITKDEIWSNIGKQWRLSEAFSPQILYTPNDLLLPFIGERFVEYCGSKTVCGRTTQQFIVDMPKEYDNTSGIIFAKISIDGAFYQPLQIEYLDKNKHLLRYQRIASLKRNGSGWLPKTIEFFDVCTRARTKLIISQIYIDEKLDDEYFSKKFLIDHSFLY